MGDEEDVECPKLCFHYLPTPHGCPPGFFYFLPFYSCHVLTVVCEQRKGESKFPTLLSSSLLTREGRKEEALTYLRRAVEFDPQVLPLYVRPLEKELGILRDE